jgi:hypothetical protein
MSIDDVISYYVGKVVTDRLHIERNAGIKDWLADENRKELRRDEITLAALKCAKAFGYTGEE